MIKLLLVDDEIIEREGLREYMPWKKLGIEVAGEASDGFQALELSASINPDIVISDIKMPGMDGIEFIARLRELNHTIRVIFISGYQDFEYARKAIMLNAFDYVLKPVNFDKLSEVLSRVVSEIKEELYSSQQKEELRQQIKENRYYLQQQFLIDMLLHGKRFQREALYKRAEYLGLFLPQRLIYIAVVSIDDYKRLENVLTDESKQILNITVLNILNEVFIQGATLHSVQVQDGLFALIINTGNRSNSFKAEMTRVFEDCLQKMFATCAKTATVGISNFFLEIKDTSIMYEQALAATKAKWDIGKGQIIFSSDISIFPSVNLDSLDNSDQIREILQYTFAGDIKNAKDMIHKLFENMKKGGSHPPHSLQNVCLILVNECRKIIFELDNNPERALGNHFSIYEAISQIETSQELELWLNGQFEEVDHQIQQKRMAKNSRLVDRIIEVINKRYYENLSIEDISGEVFFSSNYIRKVFKDETGQTISECILHTRMKKATELMKDPMLRVYDIGQKVGYENVSYFCQVFKQQFGVTPKYYMDSQGKR